VSSPTLLILVGSLRRASTNRLLAEALAEAAAAQMTPVVFDGLAEIPFYNEDIDEEGQVPVRAQQLRDAITSADAIAVVTPEHNGTLPAVLKNAIDWGSRPYGASSLTKVPAIVLGGAFGQRGGVWAHDDARKALRIAGANVVDDVTIAIPNVGERFTAQHPRHDEEIVASLREAVEGIVSLLGAA
jgi:NAD(P)H-dependent FMN reductase